MPQWLKNRQERSKSKTPQRPSQPTYSPIEEETNKPKKRKVNLFPTLALGLGAKVNGQEVETIIDSGASMSVVSNSLVHPTHINKENALQVQAATGEILFSLGTTQLEVQFGGKSIYHTALVLPTNAFQAVLGLDFLCTPPCQGVLTSPEPCRLLYDHKEYPLMKIRADKETYKFWIFSVWEA